MHSADGPRRGGYLKAALVSATSASQWGKLLHCTSPPQKAPLLNDWFGEGIVFAFMICGCFVHPQARGRGRKEMHQNQKAKNTKRSNFQFNPVVRLHDQRGTTRGESSLRQKSARDDLFLSATAEIAHLVRHGRLMPPLCP